MLLSALSAVTGKIGLAATASTTYDEPYHIARRFASLDHLIGGHGAWNIATTANPDAARNFGHDEHMDHSDRYKRARVLRRGHRPLGQLRQQHLRQQPRKQHLLQPQQDTRTRPPEREPPYPQPAQHYPARHRPNQPVGP